MKWDDIANVIGKVAPAIGTMIAGPAVVGQLWNNSGVVTVSAG